MKSMMVDIRGERLALLPQRALYWERARTLLVADAHFGKAAAFRAASIPVPAGTTGGGLARLDALVRHTGAERVVFLGDFLHARSGRAPEMLDAFQRWRESHAAVQFLLVRGNHDRHAGDPPERLGVRCMDAPVIEGPFVLAHHPDASTDGYVLAGHLHPGVSLVGPARQRERLPCFWFGQSCAVLPAFGEFTGLADVAPHPGDRIFAIAGDTVVDVTRTDAAGPAPATS